MHGIVHRTLKEYVVAKTDEESWSTVSERAAVEDQLYLLVTHYPDSDVQAILDTLAEMSGYDRRLLERDFGRTLGPELLDTFKAHIKEPWDLEKFLEVLPRVTKEVAEKKAETSVPDIETSVEAGTAELTYSSEREYCGMAHGILESIVSTYDEEATVSKEVCVDDGADRCVFAVEWEG